MVSMILAMIMVLLFVLATFGFGWMDLAKLKIAQRLVDRGALLIDVDEPEEFERDHLRKAINIPLSTLDQRAKEMNPKLPVVVYARGRVRASLAARTLRNLGFIDVRSIGTARYEL